MGFFDFLKDAGDNLFTSDAEAAEKIKERLDVRLSGVRDLEVEYDDGKVTLCGECVNQATKDSAVLMAGNVDGVEKVVADDLKVDAPKEAAPAAAEEKVEFYTIEKGDTLGAVAQRYYGSAGKYMRIFEANRGIIDDPDRIYPGQKIRIPLD